jgi:hypothetical protein
MEETRKIHGMRDAHINDVFEHIMSCLKCFKFVEERARASERVKEAGEKAPERARESEGDTCMCVCV